MLKDCLYNLLFTTLMLVCLGEATNISRVEEVINPKESCQVLNGVELKPLIVEEENPSKFYEMGPSNLTSWRKAWSYCTDREMNLVSIQSYEEEKELNIFLSTQPRGMYWTSGKRIGHLWFWTLRANDKEYVIKPLLYTNWAPGEPDDRGNVEEDCLALDRWRDNIQWHDYPCSIGDKTHLVCEKLTF